MKQVSALLKSTGIRKAIPKPTSNSNAVRLLYVEAYVHANGYYRMILPYLELGKTKHFETRMTSVRKWDFNRSSIAIAPGLFLEEEIRWADYIIFPMLWEEYSYLLQAIKVLNPDVQLVMDVIKDFDDPGGVRERTDNLLQNIRYMDMLTTPSVALFEIYQQWLLTYPQCGHLELCVLPSLISKIGYEGMLEGKKPMDAVVRLGIICEVPYFDYYDDMFPVFRTLKEKYGDALELIFFGSKGISLEGEPQEAYDLKITHHKAVSFLEYFQTLQNLHFDILMIPLYPNGNHDLVGTMRFLEGAAIGLPVIAPLDSPYAEVIEHQKTGILVKNFKDWTSHLEGLIEAPETRKKLGGAAKRWVWEHRSYHSQTLHLFRDIFI